MRRGVLGATIVALLLAGCGEKQESLSEVAPATNQATQSGAAPAAGTLSEVDQSLKAGAFDDAAARLLELRTVRTDFTPQEAAEYRRKMNEAYSAALEAAERGDPRAKAAIEMIRANPTR
jgi:hypothetical protein